MLVGRVGVAGRGGDADDRADRGVFVDCVDGGVGVGHRADIELVDVGDGDRDGLGVGCNSVGDLDDNIVNVVATGVGG